MDTFPERVCTLDDVCNDGVSGFMVGNDASFPVGDEAASAFRPSHGDSFNRLLHFCHGNCAPVSPCSQDRGFIDKVFQVSANESRRLPGDQIQFHVRIQWLALDVDVENCPASLQVRAVHGDSPVETAGAQQGRVEDVGTVCSGDEDDVGIGAEAVHFDKDLIQRLFAFIVGAAEACTTIAPDGVDLIDEDDAGAVSLSLLEEVAHAAGANADKHFDEFGAADAEEGHSGFA